MPDFFDEAYLTQRRDELQRQYDALDLTISEAEAQQTQIQTNIDQINAILAYAQAGYPEITQLGDIVTPTITQTTSTTATIAWTLPANATGAVIEKANNEEFANAEEVYNDTELEYDIAGVVPGQQLYYRIKAVAEGYSDGDWTVLPFAVLDQLTATDNLVLTPSDEQVDGTFDAVPLATSYKIYRHTANDFDAATLMQTVYTEAFTDDEELTNGTLYHYWIVASAPNYLSSEPVHGSATPSA